MIYGRSKTRPSRILDGLSQTYLIGEKFVDASRYLSGDDWGDNENLYAGFNNDNCRSSATPARTDQPKKEFKTSFGSAHANVWQAVFCDGSVRAMSFDIDPELHRRNGNRRDVLTLHRTATLRTQVRPRNASEQRIEGPRRSHSLTPTRG